MLQIHTLINTDIDFLLELSKLFDVLVKNFFVILVEFKHLLIPFLTYPALYCVDPELSFFDIFVTKYTRKYDFVHVASHWIFNEQFVCNLIDSHKHES